MQNSAMKMLQRPQKLKHLVIFIEFHKKVGLKNFAKFKEKQLH